MPNGAGGGDSPITWVKVVTDIYIGDGKDNKPIVIRLADLEGDMEEVKKAVADIQHIAQRAVIAVAASASAVILAIIIDLINRGIHAH